MKKENTKEEVIKYLLSLDKEYKNGEVSVTVNRSGFNSSVISPLGEAEFINQISLLEVEKIIQIKYSSGRRGDLKYYITIILENPILKYFEIKKEKSKTKAYKIFTEVRLWFALIISIISLVFSAMKS